MLKTQDIRIRDPYVVAANGHYYLYGTVEKQPDDLSLYVFRSTDMENWEEPKVIFSIDQITWAEKELWAPEVHLYKGKYYLFVSIMGKHGKRGTQIAVCDTPDGSFTPVADKPGTPMERSCIDGTLYVEEGVPYMVYSADWPDNYDAERDCYIGHIRAVQLTDDLRDMVGEPFTLFASIDCPISAAAPAHTNLNGTKVIRYGSDAPFVQKLSDGTLLLTWSPYTAGNYIVLAAVSKSGKINGKWEHLPAPVFDDNGGHAMFFNDLHGNRKMCIHWPECPPNERAHILDVVEQNGTIKVK